MRVRTIVLGAMTALCVAASASTVFATTITLSEASPTYLYYGVRMIGGVETSVQDPNAVIAAPTVWDNSSPVSSIYEYTAASGDANQGSVSYTFHSDTAISSLAIHGRTTAFYSGISYLSYQLGNTWMGAVPGTWADTGAASVVDIPFDVTLPLANVKDVSLIFVEYHGGAYAATAGSLQALRTIGIGEQSLGRLEVTATFVPEPGTLVLLASGLIGLLCYAWRKRK